MSIFMRLIPLLACGRLLAASVTTTVTADWTGSGTTNGWTYADLSTPYKTDGVSVAIQFGRGGAAIVSPAADGEIVRAELALRSSKSPARALAVVPLRNGQPVGDPLLPEPPNSDRPVTRTVTLPRTLGANGVRVELGTGLSGNWGLYAITLTSMAEDEVTTPFALAVRGQRSHRLNAVWQCGDETDSCELVAFETNALPFSAHYSELRTFDAFTNATRQSRDVTSRFPSSDGALDGVRLYAPPESCGELMIGSSDFPGVLAYRSPGRPQDAALVLKARRFASRDEGNVLPVNWSDGATTNALAVLRLEDAYAEHAIPLAGVPSEATLLVCSTTNRATASGANGRVIVDAIGIATDWTEARVVTNALLRVRTRRTSASVTGLAPGTHGAWTVRAFDRRGNVSPFAPAVPFSTDPEPYLGTQIRLK